MNLEFNKPNELLKAYRDGFMGSWCDPEDTDKLLGELPHPLFGAAAFGLYGSGKGKLALPFKNLLKFDPNFGPSERQVVGDCFDGNSIVVSAYCKKIKDVEVGDKIYGSNGNFTTVISKQVKVSNNPLVTIKTKGSIPLKVTSDHQVLIGRKENQDNGSTQTKVITKKWVAAQDIKKGDYVITPISLEVENAPINRFTQDKDFTWFLGYFLGDGWCNNKNIEITFAEHQVDFFNKCSNFLIKFGFNPRRCDYKSKNTTAFRLRCYCPELASWLRSICYDSQKNKTFPNWSIGSKETIQGLTSADGFTKNGKTIFDSTSRSLAYGVYYSYLKMGHKPTINYFYRAKRGAYKESQSYRVVCIYDKQKNYSIIINDELFIPVCETKIEEGPHIVYDIGVNCKEHAFIANGCIAHNCVSHSTRNAIDVTRSCEIINGEREEFVARGATEGIYGSRGHSGEGMTCSGAARFVNKTGGILIRQKYGDIDLSSYQGKLAASWGNRGVPQSLIQAANKNKVRTTSLVNTIDQARDAIANGYCISVCSMYGFSSRRDKHGIAAKSGSWAHAMAWIGMDDTHEIYNETLFLVQNSWGVWNNGPTRHDQPEGSFWIRERDAAGMLSANGSWVFSDVDGFPPRKVDWTLNTVF
jgi:hypothetical protein